MKVIKLKTNPNTYSSNVYLLRGEWNRIEDVNAVIDTGSDAWYLTEIKKTNTGVGKKQIEKVLLTHTHFDHTGGLMALKLEFNPEILAANMITGVSRLFKQNEIMRIGESFMEVIHTPGHSSDSVCFYFPSERILFSGDTTIQIHSKGGSYTKDYLESLEKLSKLKIDVVYPGHGAPITGDPAAIIRHSLDIVKTCEIINI